MRRDGRGRRAELLERCLNATGEDDHRACRLEGDRLVGQTVAQREVHRPLNVIAGLVAARTALTLISAAAKVLTTAGTQLAVLTAPSDRFSVLPI